MGCQHFFRLSIIKSSSHLIQEDAGHRSNWHALPARLGWISKQGTAFNPLVAGVCICLLPVRDDDPIDNGCFSNKSLSLSDLPERIYRYTSKAHRAPWCNDFGNLSMSEISSFQDARFAKNTGAGLSAESCTAEVRAGRGKSQPVLPCLPLTLYLK